MPILQTVTRFLGSECVRGEAYLACCLLAMGCNGAVQCGQV